jgi:hypothetical protein
VPGVSFRAGGQCMSEMSCVELRVLFSNTFCRFCIMGKNVAEKFSKKKYRCRQCRAKKVTHSGQLLSARDLSAVVR